MNDLAQVLAAFFNATHCEAGVWMQTRPSDAAPGRVAATTNAPEPSAFPPAAEGATVPFIARYRKEKTGGLDDTQLRKLEERLGYLRELEDRRATVLKSIEEQGKLMPDLARLINGAATKVELEDLYAPFKPKRRTKAQIAREAGLEPLADALLKNPALVPEAEGTKFVAADKGKKFDPASVKGPVTVYQIQGSGAARLDVTCNGMGYTGGRGDQGVPAQRNRTVLHHRYQVRNSSPAR
jgi:hypothetical protein